MSSSFSQLSDESLLSRTRELVAKEREVTTEVLKFLREVERRKLFCSLGFGSLFDYCVKHLGYSESSAQRRITSMRLLKELPQLEEKVREGTLSLSVLSQAQSFFRAEEKAAQLSQAPRSEQRMSPQAKLEVIQALEGKSSREAERELVSRSHQPAELLPTRIRPVTPTHSRLEVVLPEEVLEDLATLKGLLAHRYPNLSHAELIALLAKMALERLDPRRETRQEKAARLKQQASEVTSVPVSEVTSVPASEVTSVPASEVTSVPASEVASVPASEVTSVPASEVASVPASEVASVPASEVASVPASEVAAVPAPAPAEKSLNRPRRVPNAALKRAVYRRDGTRCSYRDPRSGRSCGSRHALQLDHRVAYAKGGGTELGNLQVLCRQHNLRSAIVDFGQRAGG